MIPVLYKEDEQIFSHNGIGALYESLSCDIWEIENGSFTMELEYPVDGELFSELKDFRIIQAKPNDIDDPHNFRIYEIDKSIDELSVYVRANTITNDLGSNLITSYTAVNQTPQEAMNGAKASLIEPTNFDLISDIQTTSSTEWIRINPLNAIVGTRGSLVDIWGGEIKRTNTAIYLYSRRGKDKVATVRPGKNIEGLKMTVSTAGIATKVLPTFTYRPVEIPEYHMVTSPDGTKEKRRVPTTGDTSIQDEITVLGDVVTSQYVNNYPFNHWRSVNYNDDEELRENVDKFVNDRLKEAEESSKIIDNSNFPDELKSFVKTELDKKAKQYFTHRNPGVDLPTVRIDVDMLQLADSPEWEEFKDLERIGLTDTVEVWVEEYDIDVDVRVTELQYDSLSEQVKKFTAGSDRPPRQSVQEKQYADLSKSLNDYKTVVENGVNNIMRNTADGLHRKFEGYTEPPAELSSEGDIWFKEIGEGKVEIWIHDGVYWQPLLTEDFAEKIAKEIEAHEAKLEEFEQSIKELQDRNDEELAEFDKQLEELRQSGISEEQIDEAIKRAGFDSVEIEEIHRRLDESVERVELGSVEIENLRRRLGETSDTAELAVEMIGNDGKTRYSRNRVDGATDGQVEFGGQPLEVTHNGEGFVAGQTYTISFDALCEMLAKVGYTIDFNYPSEVAREVTVKLTPDVEALDTIERTVTNSFEDEIFAEQGYIVAISSDFYKTVTFRVQTAEDLIRRLDLTFKDIVAGDLTSDRILNWSTEPDIIFKGVI